MCVPTAEFRAIEEVYLIRAANHSSYPRVGDHPLDQQLRHALRARDRGEIDDTQLRAVEDEVSGLAVAEQCRAFIDVVTDGLIRWEGPLSHLAKHLDGLEARDLVRWFDTNFYDRRPEVVGPVRHTHPFLVHDYEAAATVSQRLPVKVVLPGPVTFARLSTDRHYGKLPDFALALADALAQEVAGLWAVGARHFQLDEPLLCRYPDDIDLVAAACGKVFAAAGEGSTTVVSTYFGDLSKVADRLDRLPGTHIGIDMIDMPANAAVIAGLPDGKGVALGIFDARTTAQEDAAEAAASLEPFRAVLVRRDVIVGPQAGLELLPRDQAFEKLLHARYVVEKLGREWTWS